MYCYILNSQQLSSFFIVLQFLFINPLEAKPRLLLKLIVAGSFLDSYPLRLKVILDSQGLVCILKWFSHILLLFKPLSKEG